MAVLKFSSVKEDAFTDLTSRLCEYKPAFGMERTRKTLRFPGYVYGDNAVPPVPSSFRNVPPRAERIRQLNNRMRIKRVGLVAFLILASLRAVRLKLSALCCVASRSDSIGHLVLWSDTQWAS